jgi:hypothetical protein
MTADIPAAVRAFLAEHIDSVSLLETLLLMRSAPGRGWTPRDLAVALVSSETLAAAQLERLRRDGLLRRQERGYVYAPADDMAVVLDSLAGCYARRRHTVIGLISSSAA